MKKIIVLLLVAFTTAAYAQDTTKTMMHHHKDCIKMKDGKMVVMKNGQWWKLSQDTTLQNGTTVMKNGTVKKSDGTTTQLKDGESVDMNGDMMPKMKGMKKSS